MAVHFIASHFNLPGFLRIRNQKKLLLAAIAGFLAIASWAVSSPPGSSPDENFHLGSIWCGTDFHDNGCSPLTASSNNHTVEVKTPHVMDVCFIFYPDQSAQCKWDERSKSTTLMANNGLYPQGEYKLLNSLVTNNPYHSVVGMRLLNSLIFILLFILAIRLSTGFGKLAAFISVLLTLIPLGIFIIPSVNPSGWAFTAAATNWVFLKNILDNPSKSQTYKIVNFSLFLATILMAMSSRWDVMTYIVMSTFAILISNFKKIKKVEKFYLISIGAIILWLAYLGLFSRLTSGSSNLTGLGGGNSDLSFSFLLRNSLENFMNLYAGSTGYVWGIGWLDTHIPELVSIFGLLCWGIWISRLLPQKNIRSYFSTLFTLLALIVIPIYVLVSEKLLVGQQVQPRYLLPLLPIFFGITIYNASESNFTIANLKSSTYLTSILLGITNFLSLHTNLRRYLTGLDVTDFNLNHNVEWWWNTGISPNAVLVIGSISFLVFALLIGSYVLDELSMDSADFAAE